MPTHYFLGNRLIGTSRQLPAWSDIALESDHQLFVCPTCGEAWGRVTTEVDGAEWLPVRRPCARHSWLGEPGGSFIAPWRTTFVELPPEVLLYELNIRLDQFEKENGI